MKHRRAPSEALVQHHALSDRINDRASVYFEPFVSIQAAMVSISDQCEHCEQEARDREEDIRQRVQKAKDQYIRHSMNIAKWEQMASIKPAEVEASDWSLANEIGQYFADTGKFLCRDRWTAKDLSRILESDVLLARFNLVSGQILIERFKHEIEALDKEISEARV